MSARQNCIGEGRKNVGWSLGFKTSAAARALPGTSFTYEVALVLDGKRYRGTAHWPADLVKDSDTVPLSWEPALPVYRG